MATEKNTEKKFVSTILAKMRKKQLLVRCPDCHHWQPITVGFDLRIHNYRFNPDTGELHPIFVCMSKSRKCQFSGWVKLRFA